jgi:hypothetical protein
MSKKKLGQFYTTNYEYILDGLVIPKKIKHIIEPFVGNGDLLKFTKDKKYKIEHYDIDPKIEGTNLQDTIKNPPDYTDKFIITNPPYLARNKSTDKELFDLYDTNDLYKCFLIELIRQNPSGGILIIPLNFWSSIRTSDIRLRQQFIERFHVLRVNVFEEQVFSDTSYAVCSFIFLQRTFQEDYTIPFIIYPQKKEYNFTLDTENNYTIGGELYQLSGNGSYKIGRLIKGMTPNTNILLKCIDDNINSKLGLSIVEDCDIFYDNTPNKTERSYATITIEPKISLAIQESLVLDFNTFIEQNREKYNSLFLTNYRESNTIARKRISFDLAYAIINHLIY